METEHNKRTPSAHDTIYLTIIVILLIVIVGGFYFVHKKSEEILFRINAPMAQNRNNDNFGLPAKGMGMRMIPVTPPNLSDEQKQQLAAGTSSAATQKTFNITAGNFYFVPNKITVNKGNQVTFYITNAGGIHDLIIDELGVKTPISKTATTETYTFTASKTGSFVYYCSIPGHRAKGMWGTLVVQ